MPPAQNRHFPPRIREVGLVLQQQIAGKLHPPHHRLLQLQHRAVLKLPDPLFIMGTLLHQAEAAEPLLPHEEHAIRARLDEQAARLTADQFSQLLQEALEQAKAGRLFILEVSIRGWQWE